MSQDSKVFSYQLDDWGSIPYDDSIILLSLTTSSLLSNVYRGEVRGLPQSKRSKRESDNHTPSWRGDRQRGSEFQGENEFSEFLLLMLTGKGKVVPVLF
jgi:hypothetical protein